VKFDVRALTPDNIQTLRVEAADAAQAQREVEKLQYTALQISVARNNWRHGRSVKFSLLRFSQELMVLLEAGLSIVEAIETLAEKETRENARHILSQLLQCLRQGKGFAGALEEQPDIFPSLYVNLIRSSERTSSLDIALQRYVEHAVRLDGLKTKVVRASIYPAILLVVGSLVSLFLLAYVVPRFAAVYQETGRSLPKLSQLLLDWGNFASHHPAEVGIGAVAALLLCCAAFHALFLRGGWVAVVRHVPVIERHVRDFQLARMYLTLGMLLEGGLPIVQSMSMVEELVMPRMRTGVQLARVALHEGRSISQAFAEQGLTSPAVARMLRVGEQSGQMGAMMTRIAGLYDQEVSRAIEWFSRIFEPVLMLGIGLVIGLVVVLLYMPIFDLAGSLK